MKDISAVFNAHPQYIESLYKSWQTDPGSVESDWAVFFKGFDFALGSGNGAPVAAGADLTKEFAVLGLIHGYRNRGHMLSTTNPIKPRKDRKPRLDLSDYGLSEDDMDKSFAAGVELGMGSATLRDILARLKKIYCGNIGFETTHIYDKERMY